MSAIEEFVVRCNCPACAGADSASDGFGATSAFIDNGKPVWTLDQIVANFSRNGYSWLAGQPIRFDFKTTGLASDEVAFTPEMMQLTRDAFTLISDLIPVFFLEQATPTLGSITFVLNSSLGAGVWGQASTSRWANGITGSDIDVSTTASSTRAWMFGGYNVQALMHEILHAMGLPHPGPYNAGSDTSINYENDARYFQDSRQYTIMSYFDPEKTGANYETSGVGGGIWSPATPMLHDVAALQAIYGANTRIRTGDTTYGYNSTAGRLPYDFSALAAPVTTPSGSVVNPAPVVTIWDGGGYDTLDLSGAPERSEIDLTPGSFSSSHGMISNIAIAYGVTIEAAVTSATGGSILGNAASNSLYANGPSSLQGLGGSDYLYSSAGADTIDGGEDFDYVVFRETGAVRVDTTTPGLNTGAASGDAYVSIEGFVFGSGNDSFAGDDAGEHVYGSGGNDSLQGRGGEDFLWGGAGGDTLDGGDGFDAARYDDATAAVRASLTDPSVNTGFAQGDVYVSIEQLYLSNFADTGIGSSGGDYLYGLDGADELYGMGSDDRLYGGAGADRLDGGAGFDLAQYDYVATALRVSMSAPGFGTGDAAGDVFIEVEGLVLGLGNDEGRGDASGNYLYGYLGNDSLYGEGGDDRLIGGLGADLLNGGDGWDYAHYDEFSTDLVVSLANPAINTGAAAGDTFVMVENLVLGSANDIGYGDAGSNELYGYFGQDTLHGGDGDDRLIGGDGADAMNGGNGFDYAHYDEFGFAIRVDLSNPASNTGPAAGDTYSSIESIIMGGGNDTVIGDAGANYLYGNDGNDRLDGRGGYDVLIGGPGADTFVIGDNSGGGDFIWDWQAGFDRIELSTALYGAANAGGVARLVVGSTPAAAVAAATLLLDADDGHLWFDADGTGAAAPVLIGVLQGAGLASTAGTDFVFG